MNQTKWNIAAIGGGTGLSILLRGLKKYTDNITAVVTVTDEGGSSGKLRAEFNILPPGDIRNCLVALADQEPLMTRLFQYRFGEESSLNGHSFGNLFITAMSEITGDFDSAIKESSKVLAIKGQVVPATLDDVSICAELTDNTVISGETKITKRPNPKSNPIKRVFLKPDNCSATHEAYKGIEEADVIIFGPGSLYTSVIPNLLIKDIFMAIQKSSAIKIYVCNVMTQPGETDSYSVSDHILNLEHYIGKKALDYILVNDEMIPVDLAHMYEDKGAFPVDIDLNKITGSHYKIVKGQFLCEKNYARHNSDKLAESVINLISMETS